jgi:oligopeptide/dipeptide ABC transporter ATP-binding protein
MDLSELEGSIVRFNDVSKYFKDRKGGIMTAVDSVSLAIGRDQVLALVGESGSGKTTLGRISVGLIEASKGDVFFDGRKIRDYHRTELWKKAQYIHQDPYSALDPYLTIKDILDRPLRYLAEMGDQKERIDTISRFMQAIGLGSVSMNTKLTRLSGGEKQRVLLARSFVMKPKFVAADEPTTMVDFIHRNEILELLRTLKKDFGTSLLLITHDLSIASYLSDYVAIMFRGSVVEYGRREEVLDDPLHPYTQTLFSLTPARLASGEAKVDELIKRQGLSSLTGPAIGCKYANRCRYVFGECSVSHPHLERVSGEHMVACYLDHVANEDGSYHDKSSGS